MQPPQHRQWILLRGLTREAAHWGAFAAGLQQALPRDKVLALDLPGNGEFHAAPSPLSVQEMVQACRNELDQRAVAPPYHLLAMSLGAMVATEWTHAAPADVGACVLINTSMRPFSPTHHRLRPHNLWALLQLAWRWNASRDMAKAEAAEQLILRMTSNRVGEHDPVIAQWAAVRNQRPVSAPNALRQLVAAARYRAPVVAPVVPTLLLGSCHDQLVDGRCSGAIAKAWVVPVRMHPFAGHDLPLDDPQWVINEVRQWVSGLG